MVGNSAPTIPSSLIIPSPLRSATPITIQWGASTDPDGNLAGYTLQRSLDSGAWGQVYKGAARSAADNIPFGTNTAQYRVKAYDSSGAESAFRTSATETVVNNQPPTAPASLTVPMPVAGQALNITWGAATDPDGTIASYQLERSVNNSGWEQVYSGDTLAYTDTVGGNWGTLAYRVRATDNMGATGPYTTGETYTVQNGILYISGPSPDMGEQMKPFSFEYGVGVSGDSSPVTDVSVTTSLDGYLIYTGTISSANTVSLPIDTRALEGGSHTIKVTADKSQFVGANQTYLFTMPTTAAPTGGYGTQLQDAAGEVVFPQTAAGLVLGLKQQSVGGNLTELFEAVESIENSIAKGIALYKGDLGNE